MKNKDFVPLKESLILKQLGFKVNLHVLGVYLHYKKDVTLIKSNSDIKFTDVRVVAPLYQQAFRWFRDTHKLHLIINSEPKQSTYFLCLNKLGSNDPVLLLDTCDINYNTYEEAELSGLRKLIEIVTNNKK